jgi:uncharacterized delta-60 repeat protein
MAVGSDGTVAVAVMADRGGSLEASVLRYTAAGKLDPAFSRDGKLVLPQGAHPFVEAITVLPSLKIVVAGQGTTATTPDFVLYGLKRNGRIDRGFGTSGVASTDFDANGDVADVLAVDSRGRILAGGAAVVGGEQQFALARYTKTGQPDPRFSQDGKATADIAPGFDRVFAIAFQGRKILAGGRSDFGNDERWSLVRFRAGGVPDQVFGSHGAALHNFSTDVDKGEEILGLTFEPDEDRIVGAGYTGNRIALAGFVA